MPITELIFSVGDAIFLDFEIPQRLGSLGGTQSVEQHDYPGGMRTQQTFGAFPEPSITWSGVLTGTAALARMRYFDRLRVAGTEVPLIYGDTSMLGIVSRFSPSVRHQWLIEYSMTFMPRIDPASVSVIDDITSAFQLVNDALAHLSTMIEILVPGSQGATLPASVQTTQVYWPLPPTLQPLVTTLVSDTYAALLRSQGSISGIAFNDAAAIYADATAALNACTALQQGTDPVAASAAADAAAYITTITSVLANPVNKNTTQLYLFNPNLLTLAAQYYGDATQWGVIAAASGIVPPDPLPIGDLLITIPPTA